MYMVSKLMMIMLRFSKQISEACTSYRGRLVGSFVGLWNTGCGRFHQYYVAGETADCSNWEKNYSDCELWVDRWGLDAAMDSP